MEENYHQRMKHFVLKDHICSHFLLSNQGLCKQWCLQNCDAFARIRPLGALQCLGWEHSSAKGRGGSGA